jgi:hypothetical protein
VKNSMEDPFRWAAVPRNHARTAVRTQQRRAGGKA